MLVNKFLLVLSILILGLLFISHSAIADFRTDYNQVYQEYQASKTRAEIETVAVKFLELADRDDAGSLKANTLYWAAECFYDVKNYLKALNCFEKVLVLPQSNKEEAARYKVAACYARLAWNKAAKWEFDRFIRDYPASPLVAKARTELSKLGK